MRLHQYQAAAALAGNALLRPRVCPQLVDCVTAAMATPYTSSATVPAASATSADPPRHGSADTSTILATAEDDYMLFPWPCPQ
jgi:hypothetical protein